jgi:hypothetical protein
VRWDLGTRVIWARRLPGQWQIGGRDVGDEAATVARVEVLTEDAVPERDGLADVRVALDGDSGTVRVVPRPPPRPIVARPEMPLTVLPGTTSRVYLGIPVWLQIQADDVVLHEVAAVSLSDTWFGTPLDGTLCLATRTRLSMDLSEVGRRPYRALCTVDVRNDADDALLLERLQLPAPSLTLWRDDAERLWTSPVRLTRQKGEGMAHVEIRDRAPEEAPGMRKLSLPREEPSAALASRVFNHVWQGALGVRR